VTTVQPEKTIQEGAKENFDQVRKDNLLLRAAVLVLVDQINTLRALHSLPAGTKAQIRTAIRNKIDSGDAD